MAAPTSTRPSTAAATAPDTVGRAGDPDVEARLGGAPADAVAVAGPDGTIVAYEVEGSRVELPVEVRSAAMVSATFLVDADAAQAMIDRTGLQVVRSRRGQATVSLSAVQYGDNDLGPYNEIAVAVVVVPHDLAPGAKPPNGLGGEVTTYIHRLPVNQTFTRAAGRGIWGFPKWVTDISYVRHGHHTEAVLIDDGELVLGLEVRRGLIPLPARDLHMSCYAFAGGELVRTSWVTRAKAMRGGVGGVTLSLGTTHPMAAELRALGLPRRAAFAMTTNVMSATFGAPEPVTR
jgi:hypothetical protein